jgi:hypothetical protein
VVGSNSRFFRDAAAAFIGSNFNPAPNCGEADFEVAGKHTPDNREPQITRRKNLTKKSCVDFLRGTSWPS